MPEPFAKLFDTAHGQLLCFKSETDGGDPAVRFLGAYVNDVQPSAMLSGWVEEDGQQRTFDMVDQHMAETTAKRLHNAVAGLAGG